MNIVDLIKDQLGQQLVRVVEQIPGVGPEKAQTVVQAAITALLASFTRLGSTAAGAAALNGAAARAPQTVPDTAGAAPGGAAEAGVSLLNLLLGEGNLRSIVAAVASFAGLGTGSTSSLLGLVGSALLSFLGRHAATAGEGGVANLLASQKGNIEAALPAGLSGLLGSTGLGDSASPAPNAGAPVRAKNWGKPAAALAIAAGVAAVLIWGLTSGPSGDESAQQAAGQAQQAAGAARQAAEQATNAATGAAQSVVGSVGNVDLGKEISTDLGRLGQVFGGVTDLSSANAAVPQVETVASSVDRLKALAGQLPDSGRSALAGIVAKALPSIQNAADRAYAIPGVASVLKPVVDPVLATLSELARQPA